MRALSFEEGKLYVADRGASQVRIYKVENNDVSLEKTFGEAGRPGDRAPERFTDIAGMAVDTDGNVVVTDRAGQGSRMQKFTPEFKQLWQQLGLEFSSQGTFSTDDPDTLFSASKNAYRLHRRDGRLGISGLCQNGHDQRLLWNGYDQRVFRNFRKHISGAAAYCSLRRERISSTFWPAMDLQYIGLILRRMSLAALRLSWLPRWLELSPCRTGRRAKDAWKRENRFLWSWHDEHGDGQIQKEEINVLATPENPKEWDWSMGGFTVDEKGWLWIASYVRKPPHPRQESTVWAIPPEGPNRLG